MHQLAVWSMLEEVGFGVSLQHYNPIIDEDVKKEWEIDEDWELVAQMPFGVPAQPPMAKEHLPLEGRIKIFK